MLNTSQYDACIFCNLSNLREAKNITEVLTNCHYKVLLVDNFQFNIMQSTVFQSNALLFLVDSNGIGEWGRTIDFKGINSSRKKIIPVLLPDGNITHPKLPDFFRNLDYVKFSINSNEAEPLQKIVEMLLINGLRTSSSSSFTPQQYNKILKSTIEAYNKPEMFNRFYETWRNDIPFHKLELLEKKINRGAKILDAGCGPGHHSQYLNSRGFDVTGIDLSDSQLRIAKKESGTNIFLKMDMRYTKFNPNSFDAIWACGSLFHTPESLLEKQIQEFSRILKPSGILGITIPINRLSAIEKDGRFFEGYNDLNQTIRDIENLGFTTLDVACDVTNKTTLGVNKISYWAAIIIQSPQIKSE